MAKIIESEIKYRTLSCGNTAIKVRPSIAPAIVPTILVTPFESDSFSPLALAISITVIAAVLGCDQPNAIGII